MFGLLKKTATSKGRIGIAVRPDTVAISVIRRDAGAPVLERCECLALERERGPGALGVALRAAVLPQLPISVVLQSGEYKLALVEAPDVPPAELRAAMRWRMREAIDYQVEEAVIDVFDVPNPSRGGTSRMKYGVAARRTLVNGIAAGIAGSGEFDVIDIPELCLRNLAGLVPAGSSGLAMVYLEGLTATVVIARGNTFYFARQMTLQATEGATLDAAGFVLELQRSLDHYERNFDQPPISHIALMPGGSQSQALAADLSREVSAKIMTLDLNTLLTCSKPVAVEDQSACLLAVGAALREERRSL